jgi:hypothetical protein
VLIGGRSELIAVGLADDPDEFIPGLPGGVGEESILRGDCRSGVS